MYGTIMYRRMESNHVLNLLHILANYMVFSLTAAKALWPL